MDRGAWRSTVHGSQRIGHDGVNPRHGCLLLLILNNINRKIKKIEDIRIPGREESKSSYLQVGGREAKKHTVKGLHPSSVQMFWTKADLSQERRASVDDLWTVVLNRILF